MIRTGGFSHGINCHDVIYLIDAFVDSNKKMVIISGEKDFALEKQKDLVTRIEEQNGKAEIEILSDMGHQFSSDFSSLLDEYLKKLNE